MDIKAKMNGRFRDLQGGLFLEVTKADVGEGAGNFMKAGGDIMAWADPFFPDPAIPESVKKAMHEAIDGGFPAHYGMPIGIYELREALAEHISERTGLSIDPSRNVIVTPGSDSGLLYAMMPFISEGDEVMVPDPSYPSNFLNPKLLGGKTVPVPHFQGHRAVRLPHRLYLCVRQDHGCAVRRRGERAGRSVHPQLAGRHRGHQGQGAYAKQL